VERPSIYVASPLGFAAPGRRYLAEHLHPALVTAGCTVLDPWDDPSGTVAATLGRAEGDPGRLDALRSMNAELGRSNAAAIASADGVFAVLDGSDVDSGTAAEVGYATGIGVPVVGYRSDVRPAGDNAAATINLQVEYFIAASGGSVHRDLAGAVAALCVAAGDRYLFHLAFIEEWRAAQRSGTYTASTRAASLEEIGFIHTSFRRQLLATAQRHYADVAAADLVLLTIDRRRLSSRLLVETPSGASEAYPHIYGPLNLDAVTDVTSWTSAHARFDVAME
jgi:uncharacterized protein (DUF952 family)/nucleoside 2-deoxyribosyltransferase